MAADPPPQEEDVEELKAADAKDIHRTVVEEGEDELQRPAMSLFWSALAAGMAINASLIAEGALQLHLPETEWRELVVGLGYPVGFLLVILGRMQFFTESTVTAMLPLVEKPSRWALWRTLRLWGIVLLANLLGTALAALAISSDWIGHRELSEAMLEISRRVASLSAGETFVNAIPAGFLIAVMAWLLPNAREQSALPIFLTTYVVGVAGFSHSIVGSDEAFLLLWEGEAGPGAVLFQMILPAVAGNLIGGAGIFALLAHGQVKAEIGAQGRAGQERDSGVERAEQSSATAVGER